MDLLGYGGQYDDEQERLGDGAGVDAEALSSNGDSDQDSDDNNYEVCFVVQDVEFFTFKQGFMAQSQ